MSQVDRFNIRVYGILIRDEHILLAHEERDGMKFSKFPGGGLEPGEGMRDCLLREFREETGLELNRFEHLYTTDFFQASAFRKTDQIISVYYKVDTPTPKHLLPQGERTTEHGEKLRLEWLPLVKLEPALLTFPIDKYVVKLLLG